MLKEPPMISVPEGQLLMGMPRVPDSAKLVHRWHSGKHVRVEAFLMGRTPVTNVEYRCFLDETQKDPSAEMTPGFDADSQPAVNMTWFEAQAYCDWLSESTGKNYHLPSDAQWEYAARGNASPMSPYPWGDILAEEHAWYGGKEYPRPVASFPPNDFGLHDMIGNVWQWCADRYNDVGDGDPATNTIDATTDPADNRVLRGGSFLTGDPLNLYIAYRHEDPPGLRHPCIGFRVAI